GEGILLALERLELLVHAAHEGVKMHPRLAPQGHRGVESVHQEAFSPSHAAPEVHAARRHGRTEPAKKRLARLLEGDELVVQALQARERLGLCAVEDDVAADELGLEMPDERATRSGKTGRGVIHVASPGSRIPELRGSAYVCPPRAPLPSPLRTATDARGRCGR